MCRKFWTVAVTLYWPQDIVPLGTALPLSLEFYEWFPVLCALVLWSFLTSASQITNIPNNSVCLLSTLAKQMVTQAELAGVELSKEVGKGEILVGFFCCSDFFEQQQKCGRWSSGLSLKQKVISYGKIFLYYICTKFSLFWSPKIFKDMHIAQTWFVLQDVLRYVLCLLMYYKCKAKFCMSNKHALWQCVFCLANLKSVLLNEYGRELESLLWPSLEHKWMCGVCLFKKGLTK